MHDLNLSNVVHVTTFVVIVLATVTVANATLRRVRMESKYESPQTSAMLQRKVHRQRRYLLFEEGAQIVFQGNSAKSIISGRPTGLNEIFEYSLQYKLPYSIELLKPSWPKAATTTTTTTTTSTPAPLHYYWPQWQSNEVVHEDWRWPPRGNWRRKDYGAKFKANYEKKYRCRNENVYRELYKSEAFGKKAGGGWCASKRRRDRAAQHDDLPEAQMFFDLIGQWAEVHGYNRRYCIMRSMCEARHMLLPRGHSLLHDVLRILLRYALPTAYRQRVYRDALQRTAIEECAQLYGPHCRLSLLQHFNDLLHSQRLI